MTITFARAHAHKVPAAAQLFALEREIEMALGIALMRIALGHPAAAIPDHHRAAAVLALRNGALECIVFDGVVLDMDGEALFAGVEARPPGHRPALHDAVEFQAQIVVQPSRVMFLDDVTVAAARPLMPARFGGDAEFSLFTVSFERHGASAHVSCD